MLFSRFSFSYTDTREGFLGMETSAYLSYKRSAILDFGGGFRWLLVLSICIDKTETMSIQPGRPDSAVNFTQWCVVPT